MKTKQIVKKTIAMVVLLGVLFTALPVMAQSTASTTPTVSGTTLSGMLLPRTNNTLPDYTMDLYKTAEDIQENKPVNNDDQMNLGDSFFICIKKDHFTDILENQIYTVELPDQIASPETSGSEDFRITIENVSYKFGTLSWTAGSKTLSMMFSEFTATSNGGEITLQDLRNVSMAFECKFDKVGLANNTDGKVEITLPGGKNLEIRIPQLIPAPPSLTKAVGQLQADGRVTWTITYTHPAAAYIGERPNKLIDAIPEGLSYVANSGKVTINGQLETTNPSNLSVSTGTGDLLSYDLDSAAIQGGDVVNITYDTQMTEETLSGIWANSEGTFVFENKVRGVKADGADLTPKCEAKTSLTVPTDWTGRTILSKDGEVSGTGDTREITWTITVNVPSAQFSTLDVIDTMGASLTLNKNSIVVRDPSNGVVTVLPTITDPTPGGDQTTTMRVPLVTAGGQALTTGNYTITYTTTINPDYFNIPGSVPEEDISNAARLEYSWPAGKGPANPTMPPTIIKNPGHMEINNALIEKSAGSYAYSDNSLTWNITINPNQVDVTEAVFQDDLSTSTRHGFVLKDADAQAIEVARETIESNLKTAIQAQGLADSVITSVTIVDNLLEVKLGAIGKKTITFEIKTYSIDPTAWAGTVGTYWYENTVTMKENVTKVNNVPIPDDMSHQAKKEVATNVVQKASGAYDPVSKKMEWTLTVNTNGVRLGNVTITDALSNLLSMGPEDVAAATVEGNEFTGNNGFSIDQRTNTITIDLENVTSKQIIKFKTSLNVDALIFTQQEVIPITNRVSLVSDANRETVKSNIVAINMKNTVIDKSAQAPVDNVVSYTVKINPYGMNLLEGMPAGTKLSVTDTLSEGLYLDVASIKLHKAKANAVTPDQGNYVVSLISDGEVANPNISYHSATNSFELELPDASQSYIATYDAYIVRAGVTLRNDVQITGSVLPENANHGNAGHAFSLNAFGSAGFALPGDKFLSIRIKKVDKNNVLLTGAEFGLYSAQNDASLLVKGISDAGTGICTLAIPKGSIGADETLYWKEIKAPNGYEINDQWHGVKVADMNTTTTGDFTMMNLNSVDAIAGSIKLKKTDEVGNVLTGATFALFKDERCTLAAAAEQNVDNNGEVTFGSLYPGRTYWVKEIKAPTGYVAADALAVVATDANVTVTTPVINQKANVTLSILKVDGEDRSIPLGDVEFTLYEDRDCTKPVGSPQKTDVTGKATFVSLMPGTTYYLKETKEATDYIPNNSVFTVHTLANGSTNLMELANFKKGWDKKSSILLSKSDAESGMALEHVSFRLYEANKSTILEEKTTDVLGQCLFENLKPDTLYYIKETKALHGYVIDEKYHAITTGANKTSVSLSLGNYKLGWNEKAAIEITKTDHTGNLLLENAVFTLYASNQVTILGEATTDSSGVCSFTKLKEGTYYIKEKQAPEGYQQKDTFVEVVVTLNEKKGITLTNNPIQQKQEGAVDTENGTYKDDTTYDKFVNEKEKIANSAIPKTGVQDNILWYGLGLFGSVCVVGVCGVWLLRKKRNK